MFGDFLSLSLFLSVSHDKTKQPIEEKKAERNNQSKIKEKRHKKRHHGNAFLFVQYRPILNQYAIIPWLGIDLGLGLRVKG
jgi:hypothetical protein